ncbi:polyphosphate kinase (ADP) [uncultured Gammaproteobacteria bacterium]
MAKKNDLRIRLSKLDMDQTGIKDRESYEKKLKGLQKDLLRVQQTYYHQKRRAIIVFEGWDAAGKGGCIRRITEPLDPRGCHVWPISAPTADEQGRHYLYRFWTRLPPPGTFSIFDRSWYGRVLVERIQGFADKPAWKRAYGEINEFERMLVEDGARIVKIFLHITPEEQLARFRERLANPFKRWKLTEEDLRNRSRWDDYAEAIEDMFERTSTSHVPWHVLPANSKWSARLESLRLVIAELSREVTIAPPPIDPAVRAAAAATLGVECDL